MAWEIEINGPTGTEAVHSSYEGRVELSVIKVINEQDAMESSSLGADGFYQGRHLPEGFGRVVESSPGTSPHHHKKAERGGILIGLSLDGDDIDGNCSQATCVLR